MQSLLILLAAVHVLAGVFWAGTTFVLVSTGDLGSDLLFRSQMRAAIVAVLAGLGLWGMAHRGPMGPVEQTLAIGALCAIAAAGVQGAMRRRAPLRAQRLAAALLAVTVICMAISRYV